METTNNSNQSSAETLWHDVQSYAWLDKPPNSAYGKTARSLMGTGIPVPITKNDAPFAPSVLRRCFFKFFKPSFSEVEKCRPIRGLASVEPGGDLQLITLYLTHQNCTACFKWLPVTEFNTDNSMHTGIKATCKECINKPREKRRSSVGKRFEDSVQDRIGDLENKFESMGSLFEKLLKKLGEEENGQHP
jgi:hypothetical protein